MTTMNEHVERYVSFKRSLGYRYTEAARLLRSYADHAMANGDRFTRNETMMGWANEAPSPISVHSRLSAVRTFAAWLRVEDERHEVPPRDVGDRTARLRPPPRLMTRDQIKQVMQAALSMGPAGSITPYTYHYMIGLLAVTGLRRSEAVKLKLSDVTADGLIIRETKFRKSRLVPLHDSAREALERYCCFPLWLDRSAASFLTLTCSGISGNGGRMWEAAWPGPAAWRLCAARGRAVVSGFR